jgi:hypothetical protein
MDAAADLRSNASRHRRCPLRPKSKAGINPILGVLAALLACVLTSVAYEVNEVFFHHVLPESISAPPQLSDTTELRHV